MFRFHPLVWFLFAAALILLGRVPVIIAPPWDIDEGLYAAVGQALGRGELLYVDVWDNKPPAIYFLFNWISELNFDYTHFRLAATAFIVATTGVLFYLARKTLGHGKAYLVLGVFSFLATVPIFETHISNAEIFFTLPTSLAILLTVLISWSGWSVKHFFWVGAFLAVGFLFKPVVAFDALAILTFLVLKNGWSLRREMSYLLVGGLVVLIAPAFYLVTNNLTADFIRAVFLNNFGYVGAGNFATVSFVDVNNPLITVTGKLVVLVAAILAVARYYHSKLTPLALFYLWFVWTLFGALLSGRPFLHYLVAVTPALVLLLPNLLSHVWPPAKLKALSKESYLKGGGALAAAVLALVLGFWGHVQLALDTPEFTRAAKGFYANAYSYLSGQTSQEEYFEFFGEVVTLNLKLRDYLQQNSDPNDRIYIWGNAPWVYYLSERQHASKYLVAYHLTFVKDAKDEVLEELTSDPPEIIIVTNEPAFLAKAGAPTPVFPEFDRFLSLNYQLETRIDQADIFRRGNLANARTP